MGKIRRPAANLKGLLALAGFLSGCFEGPERTGAGGPGRAAGASARGGEARKDWRSLFDGNTLQGWEPADFGAKVEARVEDGKLIIPQGEPMAGVRWAGNFPKMGYEIELEAMRLEGQDFFCGLTFPVGDSCASLIVGGWGGGVCGISSLDGRDASENETTSYRIFAGGVWYPVRLRVTREKIEAWLGPEILVDVETAGRRIEVRAEIAPTRPLGFATWRTSAALRAIRWRPLEPVR
jgi:hypothetical protein